MGVGQVQGFQQVQLMLFRVRRTSAPKPAQKVFGSKMWGWLKGSPAKSKEVLEAERLFSKDELQNMAAQFKAAAALDPGPQQGSITGKTFLARMCGLPPDEPLCQALLEVVLQGRSPEQGVTLHDITLAKARCERNGDEQTTDFCYSLLTMAAHLQAVAKGSSTSTNSAPSSLDSEALQHALTACSRLILGRPAHQPMVAAAAAGALADADTFTVGAYRRWVKAWPAVKELLSALLKGVGQPGLQPPPPPAPSPGEPGPVGVWPQAPKQGGAGSVSPRPPWAPALPMMTEVGRPGVSLLLLKPLYAWMLSSCLTPDLRQDWRCIFNSDRDGKSFNTFMGRASSCQAPSLVLVRDKGGHVFGGYAPAPWVKSGNFFGDASAFIFSLLPKAEMFRASGANKNYQWCGVGFSQLPNGVGFGGPENAAHAGQFGLYVDSTCDQGMSRPIATYGTVTSLASQQVFQVDVVECWQLRPNEDEDDSSGSAPAKSALDKFAQDRVVLGMAGVNVNHSAGLRAEAPIED